MVTLKQATSISVDGMSQREILLLLNQTSKISLPATNG